MTQPVQPHLFEEGRPVATPDEPEELVYPVHLPDLQSPQPQFLVPRFVTEGVDLGGQWEILETVKVL